MSQYKQTAKDLAWNNKVIKLKTQIMKLRFEISDLHKEIDQLNSIIQTEREMIAEQQEIIDKLSECSSLTVEEAKTLVDAEKIKARSFLMLEELFDSSRGPIF